MLRLNTLKFLSYTLAIVYALFQIMLAFAETEAFEFHESYSFAAKSHQISEDAVNTSSPAAIYQWTKGKWKLIRPWKGIQLPTTKEITCPLGHGTVIARKKPGVYGGVPIPPPYKGYEGESYHAPYIFYTSYVGTCHYHENTADTPNMDSVDDAITNPADEEMPRQNLDPEDDRTELRFANTSITGEWNKWNTHRFMGYEKITIHAELDQEVKRVEIRFSPELEAMRYVNSKGVIYDYRNELGYTVNFPLAAKRIGDTLQWVAEYILPIAKSTVSWQNVRLTDPYKVYLKAYGEEIEISDEVELDLTGNIYDLIYIRPIVK